VGQAPFKKGAKLKNTRSQRREGQAAGTVESQGESNSRRRGRKKSWGQEEEGDYTDGRKGQYDEPDAELTKALKMVTFWWRKIQGIGRAERPFDCRGHGETGGEPLGQKQRARLSKKPLFSTNGRGDVCG